MRNVGAMLKTSPPCDDARLEPVPRFASDAEIALAEALRRQLEERYLGHPAVPELGSVRLGKNC